MQQAKVIDQQVEKHTRSIRRTSLKLGRTEHLIAKAQTEGILGEGAFGTVYLMHNEETDFYYALKALSKKALQENPEAKPGNEMSMLSMLDSDFIVRLFTCYQD